MASTGSEMTAAGHARRSLAVCVFAGAREGTDERTVRVARRFGALLGRGGHSLVYGGGGSGLMGVVAWSAHRHGAQIFGVTPKFLAEDEHVADAPPQTVSITATMAERKTEMLERADAFVALPGGFGTLDEIFEVLTLRYLRQHQKPLVLLDVNSSWRSLIALTEDVDRLGFAKHLGTQGFALAHSARGALATIEEVCHGEQSGH